MILNPNFWQIRPLTQEMLEYASLDVVHLENLYRKLIGEGAVQTEVFSESLKYIKYAKMNTNIPGFEKEAIVYSLIRNI